MIDGYNDWCLYILQKYTDALERLNIYGAILSFLGVYHIDFQLLQSFLECWDKDRNVFATKWGDLSISLLDIERIGGLPIQGQVYDEYVPTNEELEDPEVKHGQPLKSLLNCYQYLRSISLVDNVSFEMWMNFFFHGQHHKLKSKGKHKSKSFDSIQNFGKNTPLAAFLTLWLCKFVVSYDLTYIRPDVFVVAARMVDSRKPYSLVVPALCTLYREINYWVTDHLAVSCNWPVHYLVGWISQYFPNLYDRLPEDDIERQFLSSNHRSDTPLMLQISGVETSGSPYSAKEARNFFT
ncbi:uncharacterized protein A4U43_C07F17490 [Asparagus officinalis]|uniref:Aminotransferase-like plant mobile domain-containing protein n=1 Tax=Asparagus officinalis TaxID=4686 RepID=A0A5P1ED09_ASPOF|nr:uncharacterized protein A4U43_C07F17490 [Asparagus officinalis]